MRLYLSSYRFGSKPEELLQLLNGGKKTAVIMNAIDYQPFSERSEKMTQTVDEVKNLGLEPVAIDLRNYFDKSHELKTVLSAFDLIWVRGGNAFVLGRAFKQSGADEIIKELLDKDLIVYGGYSAGICIVGPSLQGLELVDDPDNVPEGYDSNIIWNGLGILPYSIVPHYRSDHPESVAVNEVIERMVDNHTPFVALQDGEAIVRNGDSERIVGG